MNIWYRDKLPRFNKNTSYHHLVLYLKSEVRKIACGEAGGVQFTLWWDW